MTLRVQTTSNVDLIKEVLNDQRLYEVTTEDGTGPLETFNPDVIDTIWVALIDDETIIGFMIAEQVSKAVLSVHVAIRSDEWGNSKRNVELGKQAIALLLSAETIHKVVAQIPVEDQHVLRYAQRVGLRREGINRESFLRKGKLLDQYYMGMVEPQEK